MIQLYSTDQLVEELMSRYDDVIFCGRQLLDGEGNTKRILDYRGDYDVCVGLAEQVKMKIVNELWEDK